MRGVGDVAGGDAARWDAAGGDGGRAGSNGDHGVRHRGLDVGAGTLGLGDQARGAGAGRENRGGADGDDSVGSGGLNSLIRDGLSSVTIGDSGRKSLRDETGAARLGGNLILVVVVAVNLDEVRARNAGLVGGVDDDGAVAEERADALLGGSVEVDV